MNSKRALESKGYCFSGYYSDSKVAAKAVAAQYRQSGGYWAAVLTKSYARCGDVNGYMVYIKGKARDEQKVKDVSSCTTEIPLMQ